MAIALPIELVVDDHALWRAHEAVVDRQEIARQGLRVRIDQPGAAVETQPVVRLERSIGLKVIELTGPGPGHENAPDVAPAVQIGIEIDDITRLPRRHVPIQEDPHRRGTATEDHELNPPVVYNSTIRERMCESQDGRAVGHGAGWDAHRLAGRMAETWADLRRASRAGERCLVLLFSRGVPPMDKHTSNYTEREESW